MTRKLTLTVEENIIEQAKEYAAKHGLSLSEMIENYLKVVVGNSPRNKAKLTPKVKKLLGSMKGHGNRNYKESLTRALNEKYGK